MKKSSFSVVIILILILTIFSACSKKTGDEKYEETQLKMDTVMTIKAYGPGAEGAIKDAFKRIDDIEKLMSLQISTSDVNKINDAAGKDYVSVDTDVFNIIKKSIEYSKLSDGAFDITVGPLTKLWGIGTKDARIPSQKEIDEKLTLVGYDKISINETNNNVKLGKEGMIIDLGGIAKGYATDEVVDILKKQGIKKAIVNLGGSNVYVIGTKDNDTLWSIGLQHPRKEQGAGFLGVVKVSDKAISTSGDYERYFIKDGKRYYHILDPLTGYPAESSIIADAIILDSSIKDSSMDSDALSTAVLVLGPEKGMKLIENIPGAECILATSDKKLLVSRGAKVKIDSISEDFKYDAQGR